MRCWKRLRALAFLSVGALTTVQLMAQSPSTLTNPSSGGLPDRVPFDIHYGRRISLQQARQALQVAEVEAARHDWPEAIAVTDSDGELVAFAKMDDTQAASSTIAVRKASTAARFRRSTRVFFESFEGGHSAVGTLEPGMVATPGGYPLISAGKVIGAIGCSGGSGDQDDDICKSGADSIK
jgi:glc operon protein GlcG